MSLPVISYSTGLPATIEIDADGKLTISIDLSEADNDLEFGYGFAHLGDDEVTDDYDTATYTRIADALKRAGYAATITI